MKEFPLDDYIIEQKAQVKPSKKRPKSQKTLGQEILRSIEIFDMAMRELHRPLDRDEAKKLEVLINEAQNCSPDSEDMFMMRKVLDMMQKSTEAMDSDLVEAQTGAQISSPKSLLGDRSNPFEMAFKIGMAYERLKSTGQA
ncbi:MAG: hypothetical protein R6U37_08440 [Dehalococcoidia bacterium]